MVKNLTFLKKLETDKKVEVLNGIYRDVFSNVILNNMQLSVAYSKDRTQADKYINLYITSPGLKRAFVWLNSEVIHSFLYKNLLVLPPGAF